MQRIKMTVVAGMILGVGLLGGCQPWKEKYLACNADLENLQALFDSAHSTTQQCDAEKSQLRQQIQALQRDLNAALNRTQPRDKDPLENMGGVYDPARGTITVTLTSDVLFDSGKITLKSKSKETLSQIASIIKKEHPDKDVWVVGHTDTDPIKKSKWADNWQLSTERSLAVTRYLIEQGLSAKQLVAAGRGEFHPKGSSKADNRRVEIVVYTR
ncbi:MAG: OmpA family protein [Sedimentisphaerales bacterium]|nr:OmpA family protein [Sedimentisphaerales bacterium]